MSEFTYYPLCGRLLPDGKLRIPTAGVFPNGEKWDGAEDVGPEHPNYAAWLDTITHREEHLRAMEEERRRAREEGRKRKRELKEGAEPQ